MTIFGLPVAADTPTIASALTLIAVVAQGTLAHIKGRRGKRADLTLVSQIKTVITETVAAHERDDVRRFTEVRNDLQRLNDHIVGPDGDNGVRGDVREIATRVMGLETRERDRLESAYDRRRTS